MRRFFAASAAITLALGVFVLAYRGPGRPFVRGHLGDVAITPFIYALLGLFTKLSARARLAIVASVAFATECFQALGFSLRRGALVDLTVGRTFDPWDLLAYALGLAVIYSAERRFSASA
ncbi:MAG: DUF2809 domain-containing protein [Myxococcales bacterium]|nr:DUF2809 domain-containing protein [Myxococcales bacterium]